MYSRGTKFGTPQWPSPSADVSLGRACLSRRADRPLPGSTLALISFDEASRRLQRGFPEPRELPHAFNTPLARARLALRLLETWWFWTSVGAVIAAGVVAGVVVSQPDAEPGAPAGAIQL